MRKGEERGPRLPICVRSESLESFPSKMAKKLAIMKSEGNGVTENRLNFKAFLRRGQKFNPESQKIGLLIRGFSVLPIQVIVYV